MKKTFIYILLLVFAISCSEKEIVTKDETTAEFKIANSGELIDALNSAIAAANDSKIEIIVLDLNELETLYLTGTGQSAAISTQIQQLTNRVQSNDKTLLTLLPKIIMGDGSKLSAGFYRSTVLGNQKTNKSARDMQGVSKSSQDGVGGDGALLSVEGNVHISGGWLVSTLINLANPLGLMDASPENGVRITGDRLDLNTSGPDKGAGAVLRVIKFDTIAPVLDGYKRRWLAENIFDNLDVGSETVITTGEHVEYINMTGEHINRSSVPVAAFPNKQPRDSLAMRFTKPPAFDGIKTDTIFLGGEWKDREFNPNKKNTAYDIGEMHLYNKPANQRYGLGPLTSGKKIVLTAPQPGDANVTDSTFYTVPETGEKIPYITPAELIRTLVLRTGGANTSNVFNVQYKMALLLPCYKTPQGNVGEYAPSDLYPDVLAGHGWVSTHRALFELHGMSYDNIIEVPTFDMPSYMAPVKVK